MEMVDDRPGEAKGEKVDEQIGYAALEELSSQKNSAMKHHQFFAFAEFSSTDVASRALPTSEEGKHSAGVGFHLSETSPGQESAMSPQFNVGGPDQQL